MLGSVTAMIEKPIAATTIAPNAMKGQKWSAGFTPFS
jgi:hypothetical protein